MLITFYVGVWIWVDGNNHSNQRSLLSSEFQYPGARQSSATWIDDSNNVWMYGGEGLPQRKTGFVRDLNELWTFNIKKRKWEYLGPSDIKTTNISKPWPGSCHGCIACNFHTESVVLMSGSKKEKTLYTMWIYDMLHNSWSSLKYSNDSKTLPSPRRYASHWCDSRSGTLWVFGGSSVTNQLLNDMWKFTFKSKMWEKINFEHVMHQLPIPRFGASTWHHPSGDLYLFGGKSISGLMQDLWIFSCKTLTWKNLSMSANIEGSAGKYGIFRIPSTKNIPGGRKSGATWVDTIGNLWLFGGSGYDADTKDIFKISGLLSDFWVYNPPSNTWAWVGGSKKGEGMPKYGFKGKPSPSNIPGPRESAITFNIKNQFWMFGGGGHDVTQRDGLLNDLWFYHIPKGKIYTKYHDLPGDTLNLPIGYKIAISFGAAFVAILLTLIACYKEDCQKACQEQKKHGFNRVKYEPVEVKMQVPSV